MILIHFGDRNGRYMAREVIWEGKSHGTDLGLTYFSWSNGGHLAREEVWWVDDKEGIRVSQRWGKKWPEYGRRVSLGL